MKRIGVGAVAVAVALIPLWPSTAIADRFWVSPLEISENAGRVSITVRRCPQPSTFEWKTTDDRIDLGGGPPPDGEPPARAGRDYEKTSGRRVLSGSDDSVSFELVVLPDSDKEGNEKIGLVLSETIPEPAANTQGTWVTGNTCTTPTAYYETFYLTIVDDDVPARAQTTGASDGSRPAHENGATSSGAGLAPASRRVGSFTLSGAIDDPADRTPTAAGVEFAMTVGGKRSRSSSSMGWVIVASGLGLSGLGGATWFRARRRGLG